MTALWHPPPHDYTLGPVIGGRPGVSRVFAATDPSGRPCALKTLDPAAAAEPVQRARFVHEIEAHIRATGIVGVAAARVPPSGFASTWLEIAWAHGGDLAAAARGAASRTRISDRAERYIEILTLTVQTLHERGIVHRDIKPSNLLIDGDAIWLTDFGIAGLRTPNIDGAPWRALPPPFEELTAGTPPWAAPELSATPPVVAPSSDDYSLAMVAEWLRGLADSA